MKKKLTMLLCFVLCMSLLAGCCLSHEWEDATCEDPKTCAKCGKTEGEALGHEWEDATCEEPKTCSECGETRGKAKDHEWEGMTCAECGETRSIEDMYPSGELRFDDNGFRFTVEEFLLLYDEALKEADIDVHVGEMYALDNYKYSYNMMHGQDYVAYLSVTEDPISKLVTKATISAYFLDSDSDTIAMEVNTCLQLITAGHGAMTEELWNTVYEATPVLDSDTMTIYAVYLDDMKVSITMMDGSIMVYFELI